MRRRTFPPVLVAVALVVSLLIGSDPAMAEDPPTVDSGPVITPFIVGGTPTDPGELPWIAALIRRDSSPATGLSCGATVLSPSWALTSAHCLLDRAKLYPDSTYGPYVAPSHFDVLTGTNDLAGPSGQRIQVASIHTHPLHDQANKDFDVALLRLRRPTSAPAVTVVGTSAAERALDDAGTNATTAGWGVTSYGSRTPSMLLRSVEVPVQSAATCAGAYPPGSSDGDGPTEYLDATMVCAGPLAGGQDSCQGDSGGPLAVVAGDGSWRQIGVTSFGYRCAAAGYPGVYHRLTSSSSWISSTRRFGPFAPDATAFIHQQYWDFTGTLASPASLSTWRSTLQSSPPRDLITSLQASSAWDGNAGMNARLYRAAFGRNPDTSGFSYWVSQRWAGRGPVSIANHFAASSEFLRTYGSLTDAGYVDRIYQNVFGRMPDPGGRGYWLSRLAAGAGRGQVLYELSNSKEYRRQTATLVRIITTRFGLLRVVPSAAEITASEALTQRSLIDSLRLSYRYASRFTG